MIDTLTVQSAIGSPQPRHQTALAQVSFSRFSTSNSKPTTTFIDSPITGAQISVLYWIEGNPTPTAYVQVSLPLAAATVGQNYIHTGLDSIIWEIACAAVLVRIVLTTLRFTQEETQYFMDNSTTELLELTWQTKTASAKARKSLQARTLSWFEQQELLSTFHDIAVDDVEYRRKNGAPCVLVGLKGGDSFRQYGKFDQTAALSRRGKQRYELAPHMVMHRSELLQLIESHVRNELLIGPATLRSLGLSNPRSWTAEKLGNAFTAVWEKTGLAAGSTIVAAARSERLSPEVLDTLNRFRVGEQNLRDTLSPSTYSRHRKAILAFDNTDIAHRDVRKAVRPEPLRQLHYERRWEPGGKWRGFSLCEATAPAVLLELQQGLSFLEDGVVPETDDQMKRENWLRRWKDFAAREHFI